MKTERFCHKQNQSTHTEIRDLGVQTKKWSLQNVAPSEIDIGLLPLALADACTVVCTSAFSKIEADTDTVMVVK
jgi:hypothetical protein